jgi:hypothetical protein
MSVRAPVDRVVCRNGEERKQKNDAGVRATSATWVDNVDLNGAPKNSVTILVDPFRVIVF